jgi:hypothetical protein
MAQPFDAENFMLKVIEQSKIVGSQMTRNPKPTRIGLKELNNTQNLK